MTSCKTACSNDMHIVVDGLTGNLFWCLEQTTDINVEAKVGKTTGDNFSATIMTILSHFSDQDARVTSLFLRELLNIGESLFILLLALLVRLLHGLFAIGTAYDRVFGNVTTIDFLKSNTDFTNCGSQPCSLH